MCREARRPGRRGVAAVQVHGQARRVRVVGRSVEQPVLDHVRGEPVVNRECEGMADEVVGHVEVDRCSASRDDHRTQLGLVTAGAPIGEHRTRRQGRMELMRRVTTSSAIAPPPVASITPRSSRPGGASVKLWPAGAAPRAAVPPITPACNTCRLVSVLADTSVAQFASPVPAPARRGSRPLFDSGHLDVRAESPRRCQGRTSRQTTIRSESGEAGPIFTDSLKRPSARPAESGPGAAADASAATTHTSPGCWAEARCGRRARGATSARWSTPSWLFPGTGSAMSATPSRPGDGSGGHPHAGGAQVEPSSSTARCELAT